MQEFTWDWSNAMKIAAVTFAALSLAATAASAAVAQGSDVDYLRASRCRGIAQGLGVDAAGLDAYLKAEGRDRSSYIQQRADDEAARARRQARSEGKDRAAAELSGPCVAYMAQAKAVASR